ncbi:MAG: hypothetical protein M3Z20_00495 [Chloroflexota bacterium]|nr:hypothetical protein [Chloroflexota bacterium]
MDQIRIYNHCAHARMDPRLAPVVESVRAEMVACCGDRLRELRLQGSIARGDARVGHADLDMIALLAGPPTASDHGCLEELAERLGAGTNLVSRFDLEAVDANTLTPFRRFVLSSDSLCIHGTDSLTLPVQSMERLALARLVTPDPATMLPDYLDWVEELPSAEDAERRFASRIIGKDLLKVLRGVLLLRGAEYEVAIPRVAAQVPQVAPEASAVTERLFALYIEPTPDLDAIHRAVAEVVALMKDCPELGMLCGANSDDIASLGETTT